MEEAIPQEKANQKVKLIILICCLTTLVIVILSLAFRAQKLRQSASTVNPPDGEQMEKFQDPFSQQPQNPFATESSFKNPFETTGSGTQEYRNPFENLR